MGVLSEQNMMWVNYLEPRTNRGFYFFNYYFFDLEEKNAISKIYKHFRFKRKSTADTYLIHYHGFYIVRMGVALLDAFDAKTHDWIGNIQIKARKYGQRLYSLDSFRNSLVIVTFEVIYKPRLDYRYTFYLYDEYKSSIALRNSGRASRSPPRFKYVTTFPERPFKKSVRSICKIGGCFSPRISISKYGDVAIVMNRFVYFSRINDPWNHVLVERDGFFTSPTKASSLAWTSVPFLMLMDLRGHMMAIFEDEPGALYVYSSSGGK
ncbi:uncharacterized protein LOC135500964 [Lineus longissimus]|uniref:uncharacterized protein LOC135500964 n=1 Tax=Lineus longissimus TaxID=88925 RepID=UPI00315D7934